MDDSSPNGWSGSLRRLLGIGSAIVRNRFDLFAVELQEERLRLFGALLLAGAIVGCALMTLVMFSLAVLIAAGEEHRLLAAGVLAGVYLAATLVAYARLRTKLRNWSAFSATRTELQKDMAWLQGKDSNT